MQSKQTRKKAAKVSPKSMVVARKDLQYMADVLQKLSGAAVGRQLLIRADYNVEVVLNVDRFGNSTPQLDSPDLQVRRGRPGKASTPPVPGDRIVFHNATPYQTTLTFCDDANHSNSSIAGLEFCPGVLTLTKDQSRIVTLTDARTGKGKQDIWVKIQCTGLGPGSGIGGGPDMGIQDPTP